MSDNEDSDDDSPPELPSCKILAFGPVARGFRCVYLLPVADDRDPDDERYMIEVAPVAAFGLGELSLSCDPGYVRVKPISLLLEEGEWVVAETLPGFAGIFVDDGDERDTLAKIDALVKRADPYFAKRIVTRDEVGDGE